MDTNGWPEWGKHVLKELERLNKSSENIRTEISMVKSEIAALKVKGSIWGLLGGLIPAIGILLYLFIKGI